MGQILVVINKMDCTVPNAWSESRCNFIEAQIRTLLCEEMHFNEKFVRVVPLSGLTGQNIVSLDEDCALKAWYKGPTLLQAIDSFVVPVRAHQKSLRAVVHEVVSMDAHRGRCELEVSVLQGKLSSGRTVAFFDASSSSTARTANSHAHTEAPAASGVGKLIGLKSTSHDGESPSAGVPGVVGGGKCTVAHCQVLISSTSSAAVDVSTTPVVGLVLKAGQRGTISLTNK